MVEEKEKGSREREREGVAGLLVGPGQRLEQCKSLTHGAAPGLEAKTDCSSP